MKSEIERSRLLRRRAFLVAGVQGVASVALLGRMYHLGVLQGAQYETLAEENRLSLRLLAPPRGEILDRRGRIIATNREDYRVFLIPEQAGDVTATLQKLQRIITLGERDISRIKRAIDRQQAFDAVTVAENLDWESFARINVESPDLPGVQPDSGTTRWYPDGPLISQLTGYVGSPTEADLADNDPLLRLPGFKVGKRGIEKGYDRRLRGSAGSTRIEVNAYGRVIRELGRTEGERGTNIALTIDAELQRLAAERLGEESGGVVMLDIKTGDVLIHASTPSFDPNEFNIGISQENWRALQKDPRKPLIDKCINGQYPPGSTIKMIVALAALEHGVITPDDEIFCNGKYPYGGHVFHCWRSRRGHGRLSMIDAIARSCDVYFYRVAQELGIERLADYARRFGLGQTFDLELPGEKSGLIPTPGWKLATLGQPWVGGDTLNAGIGQGAVLATPLQLAVMTARIANGGKAVVPSLVHAIDGVPRAKPAALDMGLNADHLAIVQMGMRKAMEDFGTAVLSRLRLGGPQMAGKTGTAQVTRITQEDRDLGRKNEDKPWAERHHAWFVAYAPVADPRYALAVLVEHGVGGASAAAPVAKHIFTEVLKRDRRLARADRA